MFFVYLFSLILLNMGDFVGNIPGNIDIAGLLCFSHLYMMERPERNVVSWAIRHTKVEFMAYVSAVCFDFDPNETVCEQSQLLTMHNSATEFMVKYSLCF